MFNSENSDSGVLTRGYSYIYKYDVLGRVLYTGYLTSVGSIRAQYKAKLDTLLITETYAGSNGFAGTGYTCNTNYFTETISPLTVNYYDNHNFVTDLGLSTLAYVQNANYGSKYDNHKGLLTGTRTYVLDGSNNKTTAAMYYDDKGQVVQSRSTNHLGGNDFVYNKYNFTGNLVKTLKEQCNIPGQNPVTELYEYTYDHALRPATTTYTLNNKPPVVLASNKYDEFRRLKEKKRHGSADKEEFEYNLRGWTTKIKSGTTFEEKLYYNANIYNSIAEKCYNGNIAYSSWTYYGATKAYVYDYDDLNRLTEATAYQTNGYTLYSPNNKEKFEYDKQGNIERLWRDKDYSGIDFLQMTYYGNQIKSITDAYTSQGQYSVKEYQNMANLPVEFAYDKNGNMTKDLGRDIVTIKYNLLNLPDTIQFKSGHQIFNTYDAGGRKLRTDYITKHTPILLPIDKDTVCHWDYASGLIGMNTTLYVDNKEYEIIRSPVQYTKLNRVHNTEGYVSNFGAYPPAEHYCYYRKDHLGNNREVWRAAYTIGTTGNQIAATTIQRTQYYPSGLPWASSTSDNPGSQPYKYNGKEFVEMHGWDSYDYGARVMYPAVGPQFMSVDPLCEKYYSISPYMYCIGNPVNMIDILGLDPVYKDGTYYDNGKEVSWAYVWNWMQNHKAIAATYHFTTTTSGNAKITKTGKGNIGNTFYVNGQKYTANSYATLMGKDDKNNNVGDFSGIVSLDSYDIETILGQAASVIYDEYYNNVEAAMFGESIGGKLDYKKSVYGILDISTKQKFLFQINGVVYNPNEAGNFLWGMVLEYYGSLLSPNAVAELGTRGRPDEHWEQKAITAGRSYASYLLKTINIESKKRILQRRLEFSR